MSEELLAPLGPDERALSSLLQANINEDMLREIARADHGWMADECFAALQQIVRTGVAASNEFHLREVLELTRWAPPTELRGSWMQLFACTALLQMASRYQDYFQGECETFVLFITSAIGLGEPAARAAASVLAWRFLNYPGSEEDTAFLAFAILLLSAHLEHRQDRGRWLEQLALWVKEEESRARRRKGAYPVGQEWLLGLTLFNGHGGLWRHWAKRILVEPSSPHPPEADEALNRLGRLIVESP
jgi:hypothetical protein